VETNPPFRLRSCRDQAKWPRLVAIWRGAVESTHHFLTTADIDQIEQQLIPNYLPSVWLTVAQTDRGIVGFSGIADGKLETLFVDAGARGSGAGTALLRHAIDAHPALLVDVNEQNPEALGFYLHHGFQVIGRSETDAQGRPFPLLHLARSAQREAVRRRRRPWSW